MHVQIDERAGIVAGTQTISFSNTSGLPLENVALDWLVQEASEFELVVEDRDFEIYFEDLASHEETCVGQAARTHRTGMFTGRHIPRSCGLVVVRLEEPVQPGESLFLRTRFSSSGLVTPGSETIVLMNWYPRLWWDGLNTFDTYDVTIHGPEGHALVASGLEAGERGRFINTGARSFGAFLGRGMRTESHLVGGVHITSVFSKAGTEVGLLSLETAVDVVRFYKDLLGFYPFDFLHIVPGAHSRPAGGHPVATGIVAIHGQEHFQSAPRLHWKWITAHEIGHQLWGEYIMDADDPAWLWIGLGIWGDREYLLDRGLPLDKFQEIMERYTRSARHHDTSIDLPPHLLRALPYDHNNIVTHGKGFGVVSALEFHLGKDRFRELITRCFELFGRGEMGYRDFQRVLEQETGESLAWFFEQWVRSDRSLSCEIEAVDSRLAGDRYLSRVELSCPGSLRMPVPVVVRFEDGSSQEAWSNRLLSRQTLKFVSRTPLWEAQVDPLGLLPIVKPLSALVDDPEELIAALPWTGAGANALLAFERCVEACRPDSQAWFKLAMMLFDGEHYEESFLAFENAFHAFDNPAFRAATLVWRGHLLDLAGDRDRALEYYSRAYDLPFERGVTHSQYDMTIDGAWIRERLETPFARNP